MKNFLKSFTLFSILFLIFSVLHITGQGIEPITKTNLRAGVAKVDITPPIGIRLAGYDIRQGPATGIHDPLYAVVIVFDDGETRAAIVTLDIIQVFQQTGDSIRSAIQSSTGIRKIIF